MFINRGKCNQTDEQINENDSEFYTLQSGGTLYPRVTTENRYSAKFIYISYNNYKLMTTTIAVSAEVYEALIDQKRRSMSFDSVIRNMLEELGIPIPDTFDGE